jgi:hypothetical protein
MASTSAGTAPISAPMSLPARFVGIITAPRKTYEAVAAHPKWFGMLALCTLTMVLLVGGYLSTKAGQDAWFDAATNSPLTGRVSDQQAQAMERMAPFVGYITAASMLVAVPLMCLIMAGILFAVFNAMMGGDASFKQVLAVVVHGGPIGVLAQLFTVPMNYARGSMSSSTNLGVFTQSMFADSSFAAKLLSMIDIFVIWQLIVLSIGLAVLYRRRTQPIATSLFVLYAVIAVIVAFVRRGAGA